MQEKFTGVRPRGNSILLDFVYRGVRCRETLRVKPTKIAVREAARKREAILHAIALGNFDYAEHFPDSPKAVKHSKCPGRLLDIKTELNNWLKRVEKRCQKSTIKGYSNIIQAHLEPEFGNLALTELDQDTIENWITSLSCSNKRINNILSPLRQVYKDAYHKGLIDRDPLERIRHLPVSPREPKPFTRAEIAQILGQLNGQSKNLIQFAFWTGLRTSELIGLRWEDVEIKAKRIHVRVAVVLRREKTTKTNSGMRTVELSQHALTALQDQRSYTKGQQRVFSDPKHEKPWVSDQAIRKRVWAPALKTAGIKYRNPYQTRHTFASTMLSQGKNPLWVAQQMGHKDWGMIRKVYGRWMPQ